MQTALVASPSRCSGNICSIVRRSPTQLLHGWQKPMMAWRSSSSNIFTSRGLRPSSTRRLWRRRRSTSAGPSMGAASSMARMCETLPGVQRHGLSPSSVPPPHPPSATALSTAAAAAAARTRTGGRGRMRA